MKRYVTIEVYDCRSCPWLETIDGYSSHHFFCQKLRKRTNEIDGWEDDNNPSQVPLQLENWFENLCHLPTSDLNKDGETE